MGNREREISHGMLWHTCLDFDLSGTKAYEAALNADGLLPDYAAAAHAARVLTNTLQPAPPRDPDCCADRALRHHNGQLTPVCTAIRGHAPNAKGFETCVRRFAQAVCYAGATAVCAKDAGRRSGQLADRARGRGAVRRLHRHRIRAVRARCAGALQIAQRDPHRTRGCSSPHREGSPMTSPHGAGGSAPATLTCEGPRRRALSQRGAQFTSGRGRRRPVSFDEPGGEPLTNARARRSVQAQSARRSSDALTPSCR